MLSFGKCLYRDSESERKALGSVEDNCRGRSNWSRSLSYRNVSRLSFETKFRYSAFYFIVHYVQLSALSWDLDLYST